MGDRAIAGSAPPQEIYISFDVEADGPVPGRFSMLSIGMCVAGVFENGSYTAREPEAQTFYTELKPTTKDFVPAAVTASDLDRDRLLREGSAPDDAIARLIGWLGEVSQGYDLVLVAYPSTFDWPFLAYYLEVYSSTGSPVSFTRICDLRTMIVVKTGSLFYTPTPECLPPGIRLRPHTHHALQDAVDQAHLFSAVYSL